MPLPKKMSRNQWKERAIKANGAVIDLMRERVQLREKLIEYCGFLRGCGVREKDVDRLRDIADSKGSGFSLDLDKAEAQIKAWDEKLEEAGPDLKIAK